MKETLIFYFEKNTLIYLVKKKITRKKTMEIFKDNNEYLYEKVEKPVSLPIIILFCVAYIKAYSYLFIKRHDDKIILFFIILNLNEQNFIISIFVLYHIILIMK